MVIKKDIKYNLELNISEMKILRDIIESFYTEDPKMDAYAEELFEMLNKELNKTIML